MARNAEKANSMLNRYWAAKRGELGAPKRRPRSVARCDSLRDAEQWRLEVVRELSNAIGAIQVSLDSARARLCVSRAPTIFQYVAQCVFFWGVDCVSLSVCLRSCPPPFYACALVFFFVCVCMCVCLCVCACVRVRVCCVCYLCCSVGESAGADASYV